MRNVGEFYARHLAEAIALRDKHTKLFDAQCLNLPAAKVALWTDQVLRWDADHTQENPYAQKEEGMYRVQFYRADLII